MNGRPEAAVRPPAQRTGACLALGLAGLVALLTGLASTVGLARAAWGTALGCAVVLAALVVRGLADDGDDGMGPADVVTLGRALLGCAVAGLTVELLLGHEVRPVLVALTVPALVLDAVDGLVARRTGTVTQFGGRFDGEVDAFLILVLSVAAAPTVGWWVLAAGVVRYAFGAAGWLLPWLRGPLEFRYWRKVVTAAVGVALTAVVADLLPHSVTVGLALVALALLAESFGRDVWWLWRHRPRERTADPQRRHRSTGVTVAATVLAGALVWFALVAPAQPDRFTPGAFLRIPVEALVLAGAALVVSVRSTRPLTIVVGVGLGAVTLLKVLDLGAFTVLDRPFNVVTDRGELGFRARVRQRRPGPVGRGGERRRGRRPRGSRGRLPALGGPPARGGRDPAPPPEHRHGRGPGPRVGDVLGAGAPGLTRGAGGGSRHRAVRRGQGGGRHRRLSRRGDLRPGAGGGRVRRPVIRRPVRARGQGRRRRLRRELRAGGPAGARIRRRANAAGRPGRPLAHPRLHVGQRLARLADVRRQQLARPLHLPVRAHGQRPGPLRAAPHEHPDHAQLRVRPGRLAHGGGAAVDARELARWKGVLPVRPGLRQVVTRLRRPEVRVLRHARPVHARCLRAARARDRAPPPGHGGGRAHLEPRTVGAAADDGRPGGPRRRVRLRRHRRRMP